MDKLGNKITTLPLGLPLILSAIGTVVSLRGGKTVHGILGAVWLILSLWHAGQHRGKLIKDVKALCPCNKNSRGANKFLAEVEVRTFTPGRVRLYHGSLVGNDDLCRKLADLVQAVTGVKKVTPGTLTGTLLVEYDAKKWESVPSLAKLEQVLGERAKK